MLSAVLSLSVNRDAKSGTPAQLDAEVQAINEKVLKNHPQMIFSSDTEFVRGDILLSASQAEIIQKVHEGVISTLFIFYSEYDNSEKEYEFSQNHFEFCENNSLSFELVDKCEHYCVTRYVNYAEMQIGAIYRELWERRSYLHDSRAGMTVSCYGVQLAFDVRYTVPLSRFRKQYFKGAVLEMLFYLHGKTNSKDLEAQGLTTWKEQTSREFLDKNGFTYVEEGDMGPSYGWQFRHSGVDQIQRTIDLIRKEPNSRRILINLWNPSDIDKMVVPPCMYEYQFIVRDEYLDIHAGQRSSDFLLAGNWNIIQATVFLYIMAHLTDKKPGMVYWHAVDVHAYANHLTADKFEELFKHDCLGAFPRLLLVNPPSTIDEFRVEHFKLLGYKCNTTVKFVLNK